MGDVLVQTKCGRQGGKVWWVEKKLVGSKVKEREARCLSCEDIKNHHKYSGGEKDKELGITVAQEGWGITRFLICISNLTRLKRKSSQLHQTCTSPEALDSLNDVAIQRQKPESHFDSSPCLVPTPKQISRSF